MVHALLAALISTPDAAPAAVDAARGPFAGIAEVLPLVAMFGVIYFLLIRPASKQRREQQALVAALKKDDEVVTQGGMIGRVVSLDERVAVLDIGERGGARVRFLRERIAGPWAANPPSAAAPRAAAQK